MAITSRPDWNVGDVLYHGGSPSATMFLFRLRDAEGADLGTYKAAVPNWQEGDLLYDGGWPAWRVTAVGDSPEPDGESWAGVLEVEPGGRR